MFSDYFVIAGGLFSLVFGLMLIVALLNWLIEVFPGPLIFLITAFILFCIGSFIYRLATHL